MNFIFCRALLWLIIIWQFMLKAHTKMYHHVLHLLAIKTVSKWGYVNNFSDSWIPYHENLFSGQLFQKLSLSICQKCFYLCWGTWRTFWHGKTVGIKIILLLKSFIPVPYRKGVLTKSKMCCGGPMGFVLYLKPQQFQPIPIVNYTHTHKHTLSLSHTHTHTHTHICMYVHIALLYASIKLWHNWKDALWLHPLHKCAQKEWQSTMIQTIPRDWITRNIATKTKTNKMGVKKLVVISYYYSSPENQWYI